MQEFSDELKQSKALTRYVLTDTVLRELGWNPKLMRPKFPVASGRPDYALPHEGRPLIIIEAKV